MQCKEIIEVLEQDYSRSYALPWDNVGPVSYTHLDVYKRQ